MGRAAVAVAIILCCLVVVTYLQQQNQGGHLQGEEGYNNNEKISTSGKTRHLKKNKNKHTNKADKNQFQEEVQRAKDEFDCHINKPCDLEDASLGIPMILVSQGRSGSSSIWEVTSTLVGGPYIQEYSEDAKGAKMEAFLNEQPAEEDGKCWLERILCKKQAPNYHLVKRDRADEVMAVIGTKIKPMLDAFNMTKSREALQWVARNPNIKVIFSERNPLDVALSHMKHKEAKKDGIDIAAHCEKDDEACIKQHEELAASAVGDPEHIMHGMRVNINTTEHAKQLLHELKVPHVEVTYERLYHSDNAEEWMRILDFIGKPHEGLTMEDVRAAMGVVDTSPQSRADKLANWKEVEEAIRGTDLEKYLDY